MVAQFLVKIDNDPSFLSNILWSDESRFTNDGVVNRHNCHYWSNHNPRWKRNINFQVKWNINVWCSIINDQLIGPYFYQNTLTGRSYIGTFFLKMYSLNFLIIFL